MDGHFDFFFDILLKPPQPFTGLFLRFRLLWIQGGRVGGWGVSRVIRVSLDKFRNVQR